MIPSPTKDWPKSPRDKYHRSPDIDSLPYLHCTGSPAFQALVENTRMRLLRGLCSTRFYDCHKDIARKLAIDLVYRMQPSAIAFYARKRMEDVMQDAVRRADGNLREQFEHHIKKHDYANGEEFSHEAFFRILRDE